MIRGSERGGQERVSHSSRNWRRCVVMLNPGRPARESDCYYYYSVCHCLVGATAALLSIRRGSPDASPCVKAADAYRQDR